MFKYYSINPKSTGIYNLKNYEIIKNKDGQLILLLVYIFKNKETGETWEITFPDILLPFGDGIIPEMIIEESVDDSKDSYNNEVHNLIRKRGFSNLIIEEGLRSIPDSWFKLKKVDI